MSATPETDAILEYLRVQFPATEGHLPLREMIQTIVRQRNGVAAKLRELETSIADLTHPNIAELLAKLNAREEDLHLAAGELKVPMPEAGTDMARRGGRRQAVNPELQQRISAIKAECEEILRLERILSGKKWTPALMSGVYNARVLTDTEYPYTGNVVADVLSANDAPFIAASRNVSPAMARVVVAAISYLVTRCQLGSRLSEAALEDIANQWEDKR